MRVDSGGETPTNYFFWMAVLLLGLVIVGFGSAAILRPAEELRALPARLHLHAITLLGWFLWQTRQAWLIRRGRVAKHRRSGVVGAALGAVCIVTAPMATLGAVQVYTAAGLTWDSDMSEFPRHGIEGMPMLDFATLLVMGNLATTLSFAALLIAAILMRGRAAFHKRFILLASVSLMPPALARIARWPGLGGEDGVVIPLAFALLLLSLAVHDLYTRRAVHTATLAGGSFVGLMSLAGIAVAQTPFAESLVRTLV